MKTILHIGANKTASTTLQRCLFPVHKDLVYLGEDCKDYAMHSSTLNSIVADDDIHYESDNAERLFSSFRSERPDLTHIYSNEDIMTSRLPAVCANRFAHLLPGAEVVLVIRNQLTAIGSWYINHGAYLKPAPSRYWRRYLSVDDWLDHCFRFLNYSPLDSYFYRKILQLYIDRFGREHIHVLFYEDLVKRPSHFYKQWASILGIDAAEIERLVAGKRERKRNTEREFRYHKFRGSFFPGTSFTRILPPLGPLARAFARFLSHGPSARDRLTPEWRSRLSELYAEDNARLAADFGLPLAEYGYPMPQ